MTITIEYKEVANSMAADIIIYDTANPANKTEFKQIPKFVVDLVRTGIQNGTINLTTLWARTTNVVKEL